MIEDLLFIVEEIIDDSINGYQETIDEGKKLSNSMSEEVLVWFINNKEKMKEINNISNEISFDI